LPAALPSLTRPYNPQVSRTSPTTKLKMMLFIRNARKLASVRMRARLTTPEASSSTPAAVLVVAAALPATRAAPMSTRPKTTDIRLNSPLAYRCGRQR